MTIPQFVAQASDYLASALASPSEMMALLAAAAAAGLTISSSFVKTMVPLRWLAVCSNVGFLAYGVLHPQWVMALMHGVLLPINCVRLAEMKRLTRRVRAATAERRSLGPVAEAVHEEQPSTRPATCIFRQGDEAEHLYILVEGRVEFVEIGATLGPGQMFGEIAFFTPDRRRTLTARCVDDCLILSLNQSTLRELYFQNPSFGFEIVGLIAGRLLADTTRLRGQLAEKHAGT